jgi:cytochrome c-type biogenesis protein CcmH
MQTRRDFLIALGGAGASMMLAKTAGAMTMNMQVTETFSGPMQQDAHLEVKLAPKPGAAPSMTDEKRDDLEHEIKCQCGCPLDVYTCRTTDFSCSVSPAMHADVKGLVSGGYDATEILAAFQKVYGERVLMSPLKKGFNIVGYVMPFAILFGAGVIVGGLIRRWGARAAMQPKLAAPAPVDATQEELDALQAARRDDS